MQTCTGLDDEAFDGVVEEIRMESHHGGEVVLLEAELSRAREVRSCLQTVSDADRSLLLEQVDARTDESGIMHFRFSKQKAFAGDISTTTGDDAVHVRVKPEVHPASREGAVAALTAWFSSE